MNTFLPPPSIHLLNKRTWANQVLDTPKPECNAKYPKNYNFSWLICLIIYLNPNRIRTFFEYTYISGGEIASCGVLERVGNVVFHGTLVDLHLVQFRVNDHNTPVNIEENISIIWW